MTALLWKHSLGLGLLVIWLVLLGCAIEWNATVSDLLANHAGDAFGALLIVMLTKWLIERGSSQSK